MKPIKVFGEQCLKGQITIGTFTETLSLPISVWGANDYVRQWNESLIRFMANGQQAYLITKMRDIAVSDFIEIWNVYHDGDNAVFQNQILTFEVLEGHFNGRNFEYFISEREQFSEDGQKISEWTIPTTAISAFLCRNQDVH